MVQYWDPLRDLVALQDRMNRLFDEAAHKRAAHGEGDEDEIGRANWMPAMDAYNLEGEYLILLDLPGVSREALEISLDNERLFIRGERPVDAEAQAERMGRPHGRFIRNFGPLPPTVDKKGISAEYRDGVLRLRLPKHKEQRQQQRVEIKVQ